MARFIDNVKYAAEGIRFFFKTEKNGRIQGLVALAIIASGIFFHITREEWVWIVLCMGGVLGLEMVNSAIEKVCNLVSAEFNPAIKTIKDISAGAVLLASVASAIIGVVIFWPYIVVYFYK